MELCYPLEWLSLEEKQASVIVSGCVTTPYQGCVCGLQVKHGEAPSSQVWLAVQEDGISVLEYANLVCNTDAQGMFKQHGRYMSHYTLIYMLISLHMLIPECLPRSKCKTTYPN